MAGAVALEAVRVDGPAAVEAAAAAPVTVVVAAAAPWADSLAETAVDCSVDPAVGAAVVGWVEDAKEAAAQEMVAAVAAEETAV